MRLITKGRQFMLVQNGQNSTAYGYVWKYCR